MSVSGWWTVGIMRGAEDEPCSGKTEIRCGDVRVTSTSRRVDKNREPVSPYRQAKWQYSMGLGGALSAILIVVPSYPMASRSFCARMSSSSVR